MIFWNLQNLDLLWQNFAPTAYRRATFGVRTLARLHEVGYMDSADVL